MEPKLSSKDRDELVKRIRQAAEELRAMSSEFSEIESHIDPGVDVKESLVARRLVTQLGAAAASAEAYVNLDSLAGV